MRGGENVALKQCPPSSAARPVRQHLKRSQTTSRCAPIRKILLIKFAVRARVRCDSQEELEGQVLYYVHSTARPLVLTYEAINVHYGDGLCLLV